MIIEIPYKPGKNRILYLYYQAYSELISIQDQASEQFALANAHCLEIQESALAAGASLLEIRAEEILAEVGLPQS